MSVGCRERVSGDTGDTPIVRGRLSSSRALWEIEDLTPPKQTFVTMALLALAWSACGDARPTPHAPSTPTASATSASAPASDDRDKKLELTRARARLLGAAAATYRRNNAACPTAKQLTEKYSFDRDTDVDGWGEPLTIACDASTTKIASPGAGGEVVHTEPFSPAPAPIATEYGRPDVSDAGSSTSVPVQNAETVARQMLLTQVKRRLVACYSAGLKEDPSMTVSGEMTLVVAIDGTVKRATFPSTLPASVAKCASAALVGKKLFPSEGKTDRTIAIGSGGM